MKGETLGATLPHLNYNMKIIGGRGGGGAEKGKGFWLFFAEWSVGTFIIIFFFTHIPEIF